MDRSLTDLVNLTYEQTVRQSKRRQWIMLAVGVAGVLIFAFSFDFWNHAIAPALDKFGGGFMHGYKDGIGAAWLDRSGPVIRLVTILWGAGFVIALTGEGFIWLAESFRLFGLTLPAKEPLPITGSGERALSQVILRSCESIEGVHLLRASIGQDSIVRYGVRTLACSLWFGFAAFVIEVVRFMPRH